MWAFKALEFFSELVFGIWIELFYGRVQFFFGSDLVRFGFTGQDSGFRIRTVVLVFLGWILVGFLQRTDFQRVFKDEFGWFFQVFRFS